MATICSSLFIRLLGFIILMTYIMGSTPATYTLLSRIQGKVSGPRFDDGSLTITDDYSLVFNNVQAGDEGNYICRVSNHNGFLIVNNTDVRVLDPAQVSIFTEPYITGWAGHSVNLQCAFIGTPQRVLWNRVQGPSVETVLRYTSDGYEVLGDRRYSWSDNYGLIIKDLRVLDEGNFTCMVSKTGGTEIQNTIVLTVHDPWTCDFGENAFFSNTLTDCGITQSSSSPWGAVSGHNAYGNAPQGGPNDGFLLTTGQRVTKQISAIFHLPNLNLQQNSGLLSFHYKFFDSSEIILTISVCGLIKSDVNLQSDGNWEFVENIRIYCNGREPTVTFIAEWSSSSGRVAVDNIRVVSTPPPTTTTRATTTTTLNTTTKHRTNTAEHTTTTVTTSEWTRSSPRSSDLSTVEAVGPSVHISVTISIPVAISLIIIVVGILIYHRLKHTGESPIRVTDRANEQHQDRALRDKSVQGATSRSLNAMPSSHRMHCSSGTNPSVKNPLETSVGEVLYEDPDKKVSSATTADSELSHEYLVPFRAVPLKDSSLDHDYNYPDMPDVGLVQGPVSARSTDEDGYIVMGRDPQDRTTAGSKVYYSSHILRSQDGMGSSEIPDSEGYYSTRIPKSLKQEERGGSIENTDSHVYQSADSVKARNDNEDGAYIILDEN